MDYIDARRAHALISNLLEETFTEVRLYYGGTELKDRVEKVDF